MNFKFLTSTPAAGGTVPPSLVAEADRLAHVREAVRAMGGTPNVDEVVAALMDPNDPRDPAEIIGQIAVPYLLTSGPVQAHWPIYKIRPALESRMNHAWRKTFQAHRPAMLASLQPGWCEAMIALVDNVAQYPEGDAATVISAGDAAIAAWRVRDPLIDRVNLIATAVDDLNGEDYGNTPAVLGMLAVPVEHWDTFRRAGRDWVACARIAHELGLGDELWSLVEPPAAAARYQRIADAEAEQQRHADIEAAKAARAEWAETPDGKRMAAMSEFHTRNLPQREDSAAA